MKCLRLLVLAAGTTIACRASELTTPEESRMATGEHASMASAPVTDNFAAYISDAATSSVLVVGQTSLSTIAVVPMADIPGMSASSPDGARVYVVLGAVEKLAVIRTSDHALLAKIALGGSGSSGVVVSPDNKRVYVANRGGTISVVDAATLQLLAPITVSGISPFMLDVTPDGTHLYVGDNVGSRLAVVNTATRAVDSYIGVGSRPWGVDVTDDGQFVYTANRDGTVTKVRTATNTVDIAIGLAGAPFGLAAAPDNQHVFVANHDRNQLRVISVPTNLVVATVGLTAPYYPKVSRDGLSVYVTLPEVGLIAILDAQTYAVTGSIQVGNASGLSFAPTTPPAAPTTTTIASSAEPAVTGATVVYTATVTSGGTPVTVGQLTFRVGGTGCADAVSFAGPVSLDANGKATASRTFNASGSPFVVRACYDGTTSASQFLSSEGAVTQTVNPAPTATAITSSAQPAITGQIVQFTATVTSGGTPVTVGQLTFRLGGTTCANAAAWAGPVSLDANGKATASRTFRASGTQLVVRACYDGTTSASQFLSSEGVVTQAVNPARVSVVASVTPSTQQYSDQIVLTARLALEAGFLDGETLTGSVTFSFGGVPAGTVPVNATTLPVTITLTSPFTVGVAAGSYPVSAVFTSGISGFVSGSTTGATATITAEDAALTPDAAFPTEAKVTSPFGTSAPITFAFAVSEVSPETNADQSLTRPGDLTRTAAKAVLTPLGGGAPITVACTGGSVSGSGYGQGRPFTCASSGLPAADYQVALQLTATAGGSYYAASSVRAFRAYDPTAEATTLERYVARLVDIGTLTRGNGNSLSSKLDQIIAKIARGDNTAAINQLGAFVNQVAALKLPAAIADELTRQAQVIAADLAK